MARPAKMGLDYFPVDVNMMQDKKLVVLMGRHGVIGYAVYMALLSLIYGDKGYYIQWDEYSAVVLARTLGCQEDEVEDVISACLKLGLFYSQAYEKYGVLTAASIQRRYIEAVKERIKKAKARGRAFPIQPEYWLIDSEAFCESFSPDDPGFVPGTIPKREEKKKEEKIREESKKEERKINQKRAEEKTDVAVSATQPSDGAPAAHPPLCVGMVRMKYSDYEELCRQFGKSQVDAKIAHLDNWMRQSDRQVKSCVSTLRDWLSKDLAEREGMFAQDGTYMGKRTGAHFVEQRTYTDEELGDLLYTPLELLNAE